MVGKGALTVFGVLGLWALLGFGVLTEAPNEDPLLALLHLVPDNENTRAWVQVNDLVRAADILAQVEGIERPQEDAPVKDAIDFAALLSTRLALAQGPYISGLNGFSMSHMEDLYSNAGYDVRHVLQTITAGNPPEQHHAIVLGLDPLEVRARLLSNPDLPEPDVESYRGIPILRWGEDFKLDLKMRLTPPIYDELGRGARLAFADKALFHTIWTEGVKEMIDAQANPSASLAGVEDYRLLADGLQVLEVYSALLSNDTFSAAAADTTGVLLLKAYGAFASGIGWDKLGFYMALVLVHEGQSTAQANVALFATKLASEQSSVAQQPWSAFFDLERADIFATGRVLLAKLPFVDGNASTLWLKTILNRERLLLHEQALP